MVKPVPAYPVGWKILGQFIAVALANQGTSKPNKLASLYQAFPATVARRLVERLEIHHTPKHGSWLNIAENELSALTRQCLDRRISDREILERETTAWYTQRNQAQKSVDWQFTTADARIRLKRLYPQIEN